MSLVLGVGGYVVYRFATGEAMIIFNHTVIIQKSYECNKLHGWLVIIIQM